MTPNFTARMWAVLKRGETWHGHFINKRKDGAFYEEEATISPMRDAAGTIVNFVAVKHDVTQEVQLEAQFRQSQKMEAIGQLAGGVAHDFNNILAIIQMEADLLQTDESLSAAQFDAARGIAGAVGRAAVLTRQLLLFSRKHTLQLCDLELNESINEMTKMLRRTLGENIQLQFKFAMQDMFVHADAGMMDQVLMNLAVNARDAMPNGGQLVVETSAVDFDESVRAQFGPGPARFVRVFERERHRLRHPRRKICRGFLSRSSPPRTSAKAPASGLATVFGIVQQHQGWIKVYSEAGHGTTFRVYLPRLARIAMEKSEEPASTSMLGGCETILLVEDDAFLRTSVNTTLSKLGYRVIEAANGAEALEVWRERRDEVHLLLTDMMMPGGMSGKVLGETLLKENPKLKVIYVSGYSAEVVGRDVSLEPGVNFLTKPFQARTLAQTVRQMLDENSKTHSNASDDSATAGHSIN